MKNLFLKDYRFDRDTLLVTGRDYHYLRRVRRVREGERLSAIIGEDRYLLDVVSDCHDHLVCAVRSRRNALPPRLPPIRVYQGLLKSGRMDLIVSRLSELGVEIFHPLRTARTVPRELPREGRFDRWETLSREGAKVTGRERAMRVEPVLDMVDVPGALGEAPGPVLLFSTHPDTVPLRRWLDAHECKKGELMHLIYGPEGDFTGEEIGRLYDAGAHTVSLGPFVMRAETASLVGTGFVRIYFT
jgi:16S rRNA (uracil1498-N3)-methyltransferase